MSSELGFLLGAVASVLAFPLGTKIPRGVGRHLCLHAANALLVLNVVLAWNPHWVFDPRIASHWAIFGPFFIFAPALFVTGVGRAMLGRRRERRGLAVLALMLVLVLLSRTSWMILPITGGEAQGADITHFCPQTLEWSCGPAASVSLLSLRGVLATESEMVGLIRPLPGMGASFWQIHRGLETKLWSTPLRPRLLQLRGANDLRSYGAALVTLQPGHAVTVHHTSHGFILLDPGLEGPRRLSEETLNRELGKTAIVLVGRASP